MTDEIDRANERMQEMLGDALREQVRRAGLTGKSPADSAQWCQRKGCESEIPLARRIAVPGCQLCMGCQMQKEKGAQQ